MANWCLTLIHNKKCFHCCAIGQRTNWMKIALQSNELLVFQQRFNSGPECSGLMLAVLAVNLSVAVQNPAQMRSKL